MDGPSVLDGDGWVGPWATREFTDALRSWVEQAVGPVRLERWRSRPWAALWRAYAGDGLFYAKQGAPATRFEAGLATFLAERLPDRFVPVTASDPATGLLLTPDRGEPFGHGATDAAVWEELVRGWALVQRELAGQVGELAALGVPLLLPEQVPDLVRSRTALLAGLPQDDPRRLPTASARRLEAALPDLEVDVAQVVALGLPPTLNHDDLSGGNVFVERGEGLRVRFFDLGDALVTEPLAALHVPLASYADLLGVPVTDPRVQRLVEAWLEVWDDVVPAAELRAALPAALRLARLGRHEVWWRVMEPLAAEDVGPHGGQAATWLASLADPVEA